VLFPQHDEIVGSGGRRIFSVSLFLMYLKPYLPFKGFGAGFFKVSSVKWSQIKKGGTNNRKGNQQIIARPDA
jgi:hypothetical protein